MANEQEEKVPGLTFHYISAAYSRRADGMHMVRVSLDTEIHDEAMWRDIESKFKAGFRVFSSEDFQTEVMSVMRSKIEELEREKNELRRSLIQSEDARKQQAEELDRYKKPLAEFGRALGVRG